MPTLARDFQVVAIDQRGIFTAPDRQHPAHDKLWRLAFNRVTDVNEQLVKKREHMVSSDPDALRGSFD
jgi:hypothetical protein